MTIEEFILFCVLLVFALFAVAFIILLAMKTNALKELKASISGKPLLHVWRHDRTHDIVNCKMPDYMAETKGYGNYTVDNESVYIDKKTKIRMANVLPQIGFAVPMHYAKMAEKLRKDGIENYDIARAQLQAFKEKGKLEGKVVDDMIIPIDRGSTIKFKEFILFAQNSMTPWFLKSSVERRTSEALSNILKDNAKYLVWAFALVMALVGAAIAYTIIVQNSGHIPIPTGK